MYTIKCKRSTFTAGQAAEAAKVAYHHANHWCKIGLLRPSVQEASGSDSLRVYSFGDVVAMSVVGRLRAAGFGCDALTGVVAHLQARAYKEIGKRYLLGSADGTVQEVDRAKLLNGFTSGESTFAWILDLGAIVRVVDDAASKRVKAKRGRASAVA